MTIFVVMRSALTECPDCTDPVLATQRPVAAFFDEDAAKAHVTDLERRHESTRREWTVCEVPVS